jgi:hypothetical protein
MKSARANRRARSHFGRRRRRSVLFAGGSAAAAMLASAFTAANFAGIDVASAAVERARSFLQLMSQRSPGERVKGELTKTKRKYRVLAERSPAEMPVPPLTGTLADVLGPPPALLPGGVELPMAELAPPGGLPPGVTILPPGGGILVPCCAVGPPPPGPPPPGPPPPGPPPPPPGPPPPPPPPPPPAVPEPGTWMTMILGFGLTGWMMRRRRTPEGRVSRR